MSLEIFNYDEDTKLNIHFYLIKNLNTENFLIKLSEGLGIVGPKVDKYYNHLSCISANLIRYFRDKIILLIGMQHGMQLSYKFLEIKQ